MEAKACAARRRTASRRDRRIISTMIVTTREIWSTAGGVRIHALEWSSASGDRPLPIVFVPGGTGNALSGEDLGRDAASGLIDGRPRSLLSISRRGTGESDAPASGYRPEDFAKDVHAAATTAGYSRFVLFGHSMGVPISLEYALGHPANVAGLVLGDTPAAYIDFKTAGTFAQVLARRFVFVSWEDVYSDFVGRFDDPANAPNREAFDRIRHRYWDPGQGTVRTLLDRDAIARTVEESVAAARSYWPRLRDLACPVLLVRGVGGWSPLTEDDVERYRLALPNMVVDHVPGGHQLGLNRDRRPLYEALAPFLRATDASASISA
jgi:pimeloyl-ACP methyl ester carboxylesterase